MANSSNSTGQLIAQAKRGEEAALANLISQVGPRLRRAVDAELEAVQHNLDAAQMWNEIQDEAKRRIGEFPGATETEFAAWAERLALRHIRYAAGGRAANIETIAPTSTTDTLAEPAAATDPDPNATIAPDHPAPDFDPNATIAPDQDVNAEFDPNATIAPGGGRSANFDPNATIGPGANDTIAPDAFDIPKHDPHATMMDLASIPLAPQTTKIFGDYEILETIAKGGMGVVYKARQRKLNRIVALKMILAGQFADQDDIERFYVEAEAAAQLRHPNIVGIFEVGECDGQHYFSMEYIEGQSLGDLVREHPLTPRDAATFVKAISEAMYYAHQKGVLHRDLKPSNVLVDNENEPLITDFGLAKRTEEQSMRTAAGSILGTPSYMPPEQATGKLDLISERSDVYSIGAILYELITGKPPFGAANPWETIKQVISDEPVSPRLLNNTVPADLETICLKCLQKDQARRYISARKKLADELQRFLAGEPIQARPIGVVERSVRWCRRNPWPTAALGVLLLGVVGTTFGFVSARFAQAAAETAEGEAREAEVKAKVSEAKAVVAQKQAEEGRDLLLDAINRLFTAWGDVKLLNEPGFEPVRKELLASASDLYEQMGNQLGTDPKIQRRLGEAYFRLGRLMFNLQSYEAAHNSLEKALVIQKNLAAASPGEEGPLQALGETLNLYGNVLELTASVDSDTPDTAQARLVNAEDAYADAIIKREELVAAVPGKLEYKRQLLNSQMNHGNVQKRIGQLLDDKGDWLFDNGKQDDADASYAEAEKFYEEARRRLDAVQLERHKLLAQLDDKVQLLVAEAMPALRDLPGRAAGTEAQQQGLHDLLERLAETNELQLVLNELLERLRETKGVEQERGLLERLAQTSQVRDDAVHDLAQCYYNLAELTKRLRDYKATDSHLDGAVEAFKTLREKYPKVLEYQYDQAHCWMLVGEAKFDQLLEAELAATKLALAVDVVKAYENAEQILEELAQKSSSVPKYRRDLAQVYLRIGETYYLAEKDAEALAAYRSAEAVLARLVDEFSVEGDRRDLATVRNLIGEIHFFQMQYEQALEAYRSAERVLTQMVADSSADEGLRTMLEQTRIRIAKAASAAAEKPSATVPAESE